jgi:Domain of unknown function (DUF1877)
MAGRGSFQAIVPDDVTRLLSLQDAERWDFAAGEAAAKFVARMDKMWAPIHCALSDGTLDGTLGEPPLCSAVLGDHLVYESKWGDYIYLKHPAEVIDIAGGLAVLSRDEFAEKWEAVRPSPDSEALGLSFMRAELEFVWPCVEEMRGFYRLAAAEGLAALFCWG